MNIIFIFNLFTSILFGNVPQFGSMTPSSFYIGTEGFVYVQMNGCNPEDINIKISSGYINRRNDSTFTFFPQIENEELKLKLYYKKVICEVKTVSSKKLPEIIPVFEAEQKGLIKKSDLTKIGRLTQTFPDDFPEDLKTEIYTFHATILNESGMTVFGSTMRGDTFDETAVTIIKNLKTGSKILINNILVQNKYRGISRIQAQKELLISE